VPDSSGGPGARIAPVTRAEADEHQTALFDQIGPGEPLHLFGTLAHHSKLLRAWLPFGGRLLFGGTIAARERELTILRTSARCGSDYEWGQHVGIARAAGLVDAAIIACAATEPGDPLDEADRALLRGVDELVDDHVLSDGSWAALAARYDDAGMIEFTMLVGHYAMVAGLLRSARVEPDGPLPTIGSV
jgi:alkylhydroperoxidase family enzyme